MSDSNLSSIAYVAETVWGTTPAPAAFKLMRLTGEAMSHSKDTVVSEEVRSDRQISDMPEVGSQADGSINFELSYTAFQPFLEAAMFNDITAISETGAWAFTTGVQAAETLTVSGLAIADETVTIGTTVYTWKAAPAAAYEVDIGVDAETCIDNLVAAVNESPAASEGTIFGTGTVVHSSVTAAKATASTMTATAKSEGVGGNAIASTETGTNMAWGGVLLSGGVEPILTGSATDFDNIPIGATIRIADAATAGNDGIKLVVAKNGDGSVITFARGSLVADDAGDTVTLTGNHLPNGITRKQFTLERAIKNSVNNDYFQVYQGMMVDGMTLNFESKAIVTGTFTFMGKLGVDGDTTTADTSGAYTAADAGDVLNATSHVQTVLIDEEVSAERFKTLNIQVANNLRGKDAIGESGNFDVGVGSFAVTGTLNAYFQNRDFHQKFIAHSDVNVSFQTTDPDGNTLVVTIPRMKLGTGTPQIEGKDTDVMINSAITAILHTTYGFTMALDFHPAV
tara:strand:- start:461 stop:1993 length:1533 start_codon:yes stop_codon:yes gene_type:complete